MICSSLHKVLLIVLLLQEHNYFLSCSIHTLRKWHLQIGMNVIIVKLIIDFVFVFSNYATIYDIIAMFYYCHSSIYQCMQIAL